MNLIPKISDPLAKDIRTGEGVLEWGLAAAVSVAALLPHGLTWTQSGTFLTILAGLKGVRRLLIKVVALQNDVGVGPPIPFDVGDGGDLAAEADATNASLATTGVGTPVAQVSAAGAPGDAPPGNTAAAPAQTPSQ